MLLKKMMFGMRLHAVPVLSLTPQFATYDLRVVYPKNPCWEYKLTLSSGMWNWKKTAFTLSPESWGLETAGP